jgi:type IV pilus biogenesis protein CpaD/CtpE
MSFTRKITMRFAKVILISAALGPALCGCLVSQTHLSSDFGSAVRQDAVAQIADPDAHYKGDPAPGSDGARVASAQERYRTGKVTPPAATGASTIGASAGGASPQ